MYDIHLTRQAEKDAAKVEQSHLKQKASEVIATIRNDPFEKSQNFEELKGDMKGSYSRRLNRQHRFVYEVLPNTENKLDDSGAPFDGIVKVVSMWTHYE